MIIMIIIMVAKYIIKKILDVLSLFTLGKYRTSFYFRNRQDHTTLVGGILTLIMTLVVGYLSYDIMWSIYHRMDFTVQSKMQQIPPIVDATDLVRTIGPYIDIFQKKEFTEKDRHQEDENPCGGYYGIATVGTRSGIVMRCNKTYTVTMIGPHSQYFYNYQLDIPKDEISDLVLQNNNYITIELVCGNDLYCFSNYTDDDDMYKILEDNFSIFYYTYFFDNLKDIYKQIFDRGIEIQLNTFITSEFTVFTYTKSNEIWPSVFSNENPSNIKRQYYNFDLGKYERKEGHLNKGIEIQLQQASTQRMFPSYSVKPRSVLQGLAQIGGIISIMSVFLIGLRMYHRQQTNKKLNKLTINGHGSEVFSYERYAELERTVREQQVKIDSQQIELAEIKKQSGRSVMLGVNVTEYREDETGEKSELIGRQ
ncbi:hypothetical protein FGO68_gene7264 [Halteria grandinella]|uniref:Transmembrane protein n=1 Tax=Halteria grandinella TaxID=5974 RepID=A0A8J8T1N4_HALGN|nr:hypothetical protein FGO68_gene7264 [Halteria grandinella]